MMLSRLFSWFQGALHGTSERRRRGHFRREPNAQRGDGTCYKGPLSSIWLKSGNTSVHHDASRCVGAAPARMEADGGRAVSREVFCRAKPMMSSHLFS